MAKDNLGDRMKNSYENRSRFYLIRRTPIIIRLDGKAFHTFTRHFEKPYSSKFRDCMCSTAISLLEEVQGSKLAYIQSDEISLLVTDFDRLETDAYFDYNVQKIASVSASIATGMFNFYLPRIMEKEINNIAFFDSRVFNIPKEEVTNYFLWRQKDWMRNSVSMLAQHYYSQKELTKKNINDMHEMLYLKGVNWANLEDRWKNGTFIIRNLDPEVKASLIIRHDIILNRDKEIIEIYLKEIDE